MNIFILNTGRCGSTTFIEACRHITNYSAAHESRIQLIGDKRLAYPQNHIEADNRLSWLLGRLEHTYGNRAHYLHLRRDPTLTSASFAKREEMGIMKAYREGILLGGEPGQPARDVAADYIDTVESNIELFLRDKSHQMTFHLENAKEDFGRFWEWIGAEGNREQALMEWDTHHNASA
ncbi:MAG: hypothetical protein RPU39_02875 [Candidatus Sedimenticola sp. (ex Thyasira tokunagai)]